MYNAHTYKRIDAGICPNNNEPCDKLADRKKAVAQSRIDFRMAYGKVDPNGPTPEQADANDMLITQTGRMDELDRTVIMNSCLGGCALAKIDVVEFILNGPSPEADVQ